MEFFNKKQDVLDIQLTPFGRNLLSKGVFKPIYYSFHDDNVLYDAQCGGFTEEQPDSQQRIKETPLTKTPTCFSSLEKKFTFQYKQVVFEGKDIHSKDLQPAAEKFYSLWPPIGTSDLNSDPSPALNLQFLQGAISGSVGKTFNLAGPSGGQNIRHIPQINSDLEVRYMALEDEEMYYEYETGDAVDFAITTPDDKMYLLLKVNELYAPFQKENFDIEVFEIMDNDDGDQTEQILRPLSFKKKKTEFETFDWMHETTPQNDPNYVDHYFDLFVDDEIDDKIICMLDPAPTTKGVFADRRTRDCEKILSEDENRQYDIYEKEVDDPGEVC